MDFKYLGIPKKLDFFLYFANIYLLKESAIAGFLCNIVTKYEKVRTYESKKTFI